MNDTVTCVLCFQETDEVTSCNPWPLEEEGRCCPMCNIKIVLPERFALERPMTYEEKEEMGEQQLRLMELHGFAVPGHPWS